MPPDLQSAVAESAAAESDVAVYAADNTNAFYLPPNLNEANAPKSTTAEFHNADESATNQ